MERLLHERLYEVFNLPAESKEPKFRCFMPGKGPNVCGSTPKKENVNTSMIWKTIETISEILARETVLNDVCELSKELGVFAPLIMCKKHRDRSKENKDRLKHFVTVLDRILDEWLELRPEQSSVRYEIRGSITVPDGRQLRDISSGPDSDDVESVIAKHESPECSEQDDRSSDIQKDAGEEEEHGSVKYEVDFGSEVKIDPKRPPIKRQVAAGPGGVAAVGFEPLPSTPRIGDSRNKNPYFPLDSGYYSTPGTTASKTPDSLFSQLYSQASSVSSVSTDQTAPQTWSQTRSLREHKMQMESPTKGRGHPSITGLDASLNPVKTLGFGSNTFEEEDGDEHNDAQSTWEDSRVCSKKLFQTSQKSLMKFEPYNKGISTVEDSFAHMRGAYKEVPGWIYCFTTESAWGHMKIGYTSDESDLSVLQEAGGALKPDFFGPEGPPLSRMKTHKDSCKYKPDVQFSCYMPCAVTKMETLIHTTLHQKRRIVANCQCGKLHDEWFEVSVDEARSVCKVWQSFSKLMPYRKSGQLEANWGDYATARARQTPKTEWTKSAIDDWRQVIEEAKARQEESKALQNRSKGLEDLKAKIQAEKQELSRAAEQLTAALEENLGKQKRMEEQLREILQDETDNRAKQARLDGSVVERLPEAA